MAIEKLDKIIPDAYNRNAKLYPMLIVILPLILAFWAIVPDKLYDWETIMAIVVWCGGARLLMEYGRDLGKTKENQLWERWGGAPTTQYLRHRGSTNKATLQRVHKNLKNIIPNIELPTLDEEDKDPKKADSIYEECTRVMKAKTRDSKKFALLFKENCSYGFRRNLLGLRHWGLSLTILCVLAIALAILLDWRTNHSLESYNAVICEIINVAIFFFWLTLNEKRVKIPAFAYAERLFEATEQLAKTNDT